MTSNLLSKFSRLIRSFVRGEIAFYISPQKQVFLERDIAPKTLDFEAPKANRKRQPGAFNLGNGKALRKLGLKPCNNAASKILALRPF